jgi:hypothetical protein
VIIHRVSCYVPGTGLLHASYDVSPALLDYARKIVGSDADDPQMLGPYPLRPDHLAELARAAGWQLALTHTMSAFWKHSSMTRCSPLFAAGSNRGPCKEWNGRTDSSERSGSARLR